MSGEAMLMTKRTSNLPPHQQPTTPLPSLASGSSLFSNFKASGKPHVIYHSLCMLETTYNHLISTYRPIKRAKHIISYKLS